jgi:hypothetical protein
VFVDHEFLGEDHFSQFCYFFFVFLFEVPNLMFEGSDGFLIVFIGVLEFFAHFLVFRDLRIGVVFEFLEIG